MPGSLVMTKVAVTSMGYSLKPDVTLMVISCIRNDVTKFRQPPLSRDCFIATFLYEGCVIEIERGFAGDKQWLSGNRFDNFTDVSS